jgi:hypothetical protein
VNASKIAILNTVKCLGLGISPKENYPNCQCKFYVHVVCTANVVLNLNAKKRAGQARLFFLYNSKELVHS